MKTSVIVYNRENYNEMMKTKNCLCGLPNKEPIQCMCEEFQKMEVGICQCLVFERIETKEE